MLLVWLISILPVSQTTEVTLQLEALKESSGVCVSAAGDVWSHNDSGDAPRLFAFRRDGTSIAECQINGARAIDWEDMCSFTLDGKSYFAVGDVGDNNSKRSSVQIYVVEQPGPDLMARKRFALPVQCCLTVQYPSGAVNCEALAFDPVTNSFLLVSKQALYCQLYRVPVKDLRQDRTVMAVAGPKLVVPMVTGADVTADGSRLVLSTYGPGVLVEREPDGAREWLTSRPQTFQLPSRKLGESICFTADAASLLLTSEFAPAPLFTVPCPAPSSR